MCPTPLEIAAEGRISRPPVTDDRSREVLAEDFRGNITPRLSLTAYNVC